MLWKTLSGLSLLSLASVSVSAKDLRFDHGPAGADKAHIPSVVPGKFIVEFHDVVPDSYGDGNVVDHFFDDLGKKGIRPVGGLNYTGNIFKGCSFKVDKKTNPDDILSLDVVKHIWPVRTMALPRVKIHQKGTDAKAPIWTSHAGTGVLDMHKKGFLGEGAVVGIVDSGIDYTHPAFGGSWGPGKKIIGGKDLIGDKWAPGETPHPDNDFMDCSGHGTHVAGIIAGEPTDGRFISVAPKAKLRAYRIFPCQGNTDNDQIIAAFLQAHADGVDIINASMGAPSGWTDDPWQRVADKLVKEGVFIAISAGNDGTAGPWYAASGSSAVDVIAVASVENEQLLLVRAEVTSGKEKKTMLYRDAAESLDGWRLNQDLEVYATSTNLTIADDACSPLPANTPDLKGKLVVVRRGTCDFNDKAKNVAAKGGQYLMLYTNENPAAIPLVNSTIIKYAGMLEAADGEYLVKSFAAKKKTSVFFPKVAQVVKPNNATGGYASSFTQWGPTWEGFMKPEIGAPGGGIASTYLMSEGGYAVMSGTSMSSPYIAGIAALYIGRAGGRKNLPPGAAVELKRRIISSGRALKWNDGFVTDQTRYAPIAQIGGGYVNATKVMMYDTSVSPAKLELNDTLHFTPKHFINIKNSGKSEVIYKFTHLPADTFYTFEPGFTMPKPFPPSWANRSASVKFSTKALRIRPGATNSFGVTFLPPQGLDETLLPVYGGKIIITGTNGERLEVPYMGVSGSIKSQRIWNIDNGLPEVKSATNMTGPQNLTLHSTNLPTFTYINDWGSREMRFDIVTPDWTERNFTYPPVVGKNGFFGNMVTDDGFPFPSLGETRNNPLVEGAQVTNFTWNGNITDGKHHRLVEPGQYRVNMRALRVFGNPRLAEDWVSVMSPVFTVLDGKK